MDEIIPSVGAVVFKGDKVLLVRKKNHPRQILQLPGGQIEHGETPEQAVVRELYENTGMTVSPPEITILRNEWQARIEKDYGTKVFNLKCGFCRQYTGTPKETDIAVPMWVRRSELGNLDLVANVEAAIRAAESLFEK